mmetsp:Transcript_3694/g.6780  ORF Transcript_3694/g.6780 Transcript_3694/m.6780 type:complete len:231 (-) Transcript_3694:690-1382(-)
MVNGIDPITDVVFKVVCRHHFQLLHPRAVPFIKGNPLKARRFEASNAVSRIDDLLQHEREPKGHSPVVCAVANTRRVLQENVVESATSQQFTCGGHHCGLKSFHIHLQQRHRLLYHFVNALRKADNLQVGPFVVDGAVDVHPPNARSAPNPTLWHNHRLRHAFVGDDRVTHFHEMPYIVDEYIVEKVRTKSRDRFPSHHSAAHLRGVNGVPAKVPTYVNHQLRLRGTALR